MLKNVTIDDILRDYCHIIDDKHLSEDNIEIDENLVVEDSSAKYTQLFASFLNEAYYRGYAIGSDILKRLMDIIEYEGYEYQIMEKYVDILLSHMNDYKVDEVNRPVFREKVLGYKESIEFVSEYVKIMSERIYINSTDLVHFTNDNPGNKESAFCPHVLKSEEYPEGFIYTDIMQNLKLKSPMDVDYFIKGCYIIYKDKEASLAYYNILNNAKSLDVLMQSVFFLLDEKDMDSIDILTDKVKSLEALKICIDLYYKYYEIKGQLSMIVSRNIERLLNLITRNLPIEMVAVIVGKDYKFWEKVWSDTHCITDILSSALSVYKNSNGALEYRDHLDCIMNLLEFDNTANDIYFYARYFVLNMDYQILCDNYIKIFTELYKYLTIGECYELIDQVIDGLFNIENSSVDAELIKLSKYLDEVTREEFMDPILKYTCSTINSYMEE